MLDIMTGLEIQVDRMKENLHFQKAQISSEWLLFRLSGKIGKMKSLEKLHELSEKATGTGISLKDAVMDDPEIGSLLTPEELEYLDHPERYLGHAVEIVDHTIKEIQEKRAQDPEKL
jgi:3-carboxy-cis,cis-muconate cycloisomerase